MGASRKRSTPCYRDNSDDEISESKQPHTLTLNNIPLHKLTDKIGGNSSLNIGIKTTDRKLTMLDSISNVIDRNFDEPTNSNVIGKLPTEKDKNSLGELCDYADINSIPELHNTNDKDKFEITRDFLHLNVNLWKFVEKQCKTQNVYDLTPSLEDYIMHAKNIHQKYKRNCEAANETFDLYPTVKANNNNNNNNNITKKGRQTMDCLKETIQINPLQSILNRNESQKDNLLSNNDQFSKPISLNDRESIFQKNPLLNDNPKDDINAPSSGNSLSLSHTISTKNIDPLNSQKKVMFNISAGDSKTASMNNNQQDKLISNCGMSFMDIGNKINVGNTLLNNKTLIPQDETSGNKFNVIKNLVNDNKNIDSSYFSLTSASNDNNHSLNSTESNFSKFGSINSGSNLFTEKMSTTPKDTSKIENKQAIGSKFSSIFGSTMPSYMPNLSDSSSQANKVDNISKTLDKTGSSSVGISSQNSTLNTMFSPFNMNEKTKINSQHNLLSPSTKLEPPLTSMTTKTNNIIPFSLNMPNSSDSPFITPKPFGSNSSFSLGLGNSGTTLANNPPSLGGSSIFTNINMKSTGNGSTVNNEEDEEGEVTQQEQEEQAKQQTVKAIENNAFYHQMCKLYYKKDDKWKLIGCGVANLIESKNSKDSTPQVILVLRQSPSSNARVLLNIRLSKAFDSNNVLEPAGLCFVSPANPPIQNEKDDEPFTFLLKFKEKSTCLEFRDKFNEKFNV